MTSLSYSPLLSLLLAAPVLASPTPEVSLTEPLRLELDAQIPSKSPSLLFSLGRVRRRVGSAPAQDAAMGMALRCVGHGMKVAIIQFVKGAIETGESKALAHFPELVKFHRLGEGFTWETQDRDRDIEMAKKAWSVTKQYLQDPSFSMVILDELNIILRNDYLPLSDVIADLKAKPDMQHVVVTGRSAKQDLLDAADLVTEMGMVKHPFRKGI